MFNYFACRKIAEEELNKSLKDVMDYKQQEKMKGKCLSRFLNTNYVANRDKLAKRYKLRVVGFVKDVSYWLHIHY